MQSRRVVALAALLVGPRRPRRAAAPPRPSQDALVRDALARYQAGLDAIKTAAKPRPPAGATAQAGRPIRDIRLTDVVAARAREEPRHCRRAAQSAVRRSADCGHPATPTCRWPRQRSGSATTTSCRATSCRAASACRSRTTTYNAGVDAERAVVRRQLRAARGTTTSRIPRARSSPSTRRSRRA